MLTFDHPQLGIVQIRVNSKARRQILRVRSNAVIITVPPGCEKSVLPLSEQTINNVFSMRNRLRERSETSGRFELGVPISTLTFTTDISFHDNPKIRSYGAKIDNGVLYIRIPVGLSFDSNIVQNALLRILHKFLRQEAELLLPVKLDHLSKECGLNYKSVKIDSAKSRWGCCSSFKDIKLSFYLMLLPEKIVDYIIVHELCHTKEMNHGPRFKALLHGFFPDYQIIEKEKVNWDYRVEWLKNNI